MKEEIIQNGIKDKTTRDRIYDWALETAEKHKVKE